MKHAHEMPFGAEYRADATRFALWAPQCREISLRLGGDGVRRLPMRCQDDGWHRLDVEGVKPGEAYSFALDIDRLVVPDPASRSNPGDVRQPSAVVDPLAYEWRDDGWKGRPWREAVLYELHVGTFTREGTYLAVIEKLDHLRDLGVTAVELMPVADFCGRRNWGYDGVLPFAPDAAYGKPEELKRLVDEAHARGLMVVLDVVYNHFGPEGNFLHAYAPQFFNPAHQTPWGAAVNYDGEHARTVRDFFIHNALYWLEEFRFDGLRLDAVHAIADDSLPHIVTEIAQAIAAGPARERRVHLILENEANEARHLERRGGHATAQWNDDLHHPIHVLLTGEKDGYYAEFAARPAWWLGRSLAEGFGFQGEAAAHRNGEPRGESSAHLPPEAFIGFLQNHDQVGNRALGERLTMLAAPGPLRLATATLLLAPSIPLLFMGEEIGATSPFLYFCDYQGDLAAAVREGRRREFAAFERFREPAQRERIPDPNAEDTFIASRIPWESADHQCVEHYRTLLALRAREIVPRLGDTTTQGRFVIEGSSGIAVDWALDDGSTLHLRANFGGEAVRLQPAAGRMLHFEGERPRGDVVAAWSGAWLLEDPL